MLLSWTFLFYIFNVFTYSSLQRLSIRDIVIVILNQRDSHDIFLANNLAKSVQEQSKTFKESSPIIHFSSTESSHPGAWTIFPLIPWLESIHRKNGSFILFCPSSTEINLMRLMKYLQKLDPQQEKFLGYALSDRDATIIHHFALPQKARPFKYPSFASGFILSQALLVRLAQRLRAGDLPKHAEFSIDASYELSLYIWDEGKGNELTHADVFCVKPGPHCALRPIAFKPCGEAVSRDEIYFAVKTCSKFHKDRLPVVKKTWGSHANLIGYFSDIEDLELGTISLGVPNTERGHCGKTQAILHYAVNQSTMNNRIKWLVIADDDTILSVGQMQLLLSCYNATSKVALGERYGFNVALPDNSGGYNYITGGGSMVFSLEVVRKLKETCVCPSDSTPDDMYLGICLANLGVPLTHSPKFHQARPTDYAADHLVSYEPVSFHKHWMVDPYQVYRDWFHHIDVKFRKGEPHSEL